MTTTVTTNPPPTNLLHVQFKNPEHLTYLSTLPPPPSSTTTSSSSSSASASPLNTHNILDYFSTSPFYDRSSNNEQIRMQNIANGLHPNAGPSAAQLERELCRFLGLEFVCTSAKAGVFVLQRRWRFGPALSDVTPLATYYTINESIYQSPDLYTVLSSRLHSTTHTLRTSLTHQRHARATFNPRTGHHGRFIRSSSPDRLPSPTDQPSPTDPTTPPDQNL